MNPLEHIKAARNLLTRRGWRQGFLAQGHASEDPSPLCLGEAAVADRQAEIFIDQAVRELFPDRIGTRVFPTVRFNDHPDTTWEDVERVLDRAEEIASETGAE